MDMKKQKDYMRFVKTWVEAKKNHQNTEWVAKKLKVDQDEIRGAAVYLRNRGVMLPSLKNTVDIPTEEYNRYIVENLK